MSSGTVAMKLAPAALARRTIAATRALPPPWPRAPTCRTSWPLPANGGESGCPKHDRAECGCEERFHYYYYYYYSCYYYYYYFHFHFYFYFYFYYFYFYF